MTRVTAAVTYGRNDSRRLRYEQIKQSGQSSNDGYAVRSAADWFKSNTVSVSDDRIITLTTGTDLSDLKKNREAPASAKTGPNPIA